MKTIQVLNMLSNFKTTNRNLVGNGVFYLMDAVSMEEAAIFDVVLSQLTGTRSVAMEKFVLSKSVRDSIRKNTAMSVLECALEVDMSGTKNRYGTGGKRTFRSSGNFMERFLSTMERNQSYLLTVPDEFFKGAHRASAEQTQKLIDRGKIKTSNKNYASEQAEQLAKYCTFQDSALLSTATQQIHDVFNLVGFGDVSKEMQRVRQATGLRPMDFINYRDMLSRAGDEQSRQEANAAVREAIFADPTLTADQKAALDDALISDIIIIPQEKDVVYSDRDSYVVTQMSDSAQEHWPEIRDRFGLDGDTFKEVWTICQSKDYKAAEKWQLLNNMGLNGKAIYQAIKGRK